MLVILAALLFGFAWLLHGSGAHMPVWFDWRGMALLGLVSLAPGGLWHPVIPWRRQ